MTEQAFRAGSPAARSPIEAAGMNAALIMYLDSSTNLSDPTERMLETVEGDKTSEVAALARSASQTRAIAADFASEHVDRWTRESKPSVSPLVESYPSSLGDRTL